MNYSFLIMYFTTVDSLKGFRTLYVYGLLLSSSSRAFASSSLMCISFFSAWKSSISRSLRTCLSTLTGKFGFASFESSDGSKCLNLSKDFSVRVISYYLLISDIDCSHCESKNRSFAACLYALTIISVGTMF